MSVAQLQLDLDVFAGPFDLLLTLVLKQEIDLLEVSLVDVVLAYVEHLEAADDLDLETATEFLVLIAALLELKSRLMLPSAEDEEMPAPEEAAEELVARMLEYRRYRRVAEHLRALRDAERGHLYRSAPLPPELRRVALEVAEPVYEPEPLAVAIGDLLVPPPAVDTSHIRPTVSLDRRLAVLRRMLAAGGRFDFEDAVAGVDRITQAVTLFALLELYKKGEATWTQRETFGPITVEAA